MILRAASIDIWRDVHKDEASIELKIGCPLRGDGGDATYRCTDNEWGRFQRITQSQQVSVPEPSLRHPCGVTA
jgi:hypothetical protein